MRNSLKPQVRSREYNEHRSSAQERGYNTRWKKASETYLMHNPLYVMRQKERWATPTTVVATSSLIRETRLSSGIPSTIDRPCASHTITETRRGKSEEASRL